LYALSAGNTDAYAGDVIVEWQRIVGIIETETLVGRPPGGAPCDIGINCVPGTPAPWVATSGYVAVNLGNGDVAFEVKGLVVGGDPSFANMGTTSVVKRVKATLVCNDTTPGIPELVDTPSVPLSARGNASFSGHVSLPWSCIAEPEDIVFLIRIAKVSEPSFKFPLLDRWNAFGAIRIITNGGSEKVI
jgi:hypothetical protein